MSTHDADDIEPTYKLVARVFRLAVRDAQRGCPDACEWLRCVAPDYYDELLRAKELPGRRAKTAGYGR